MSGKAEAQIGKEVSEVAALSIGSDRSTVHISHTPLL